ncbi:hypothetical protein [Alicyclobacillus fructus]|uniref:hypothetical protein n=1 Tax=Alicyclobacillus fructus TaxID=2816082 RepID=UPI001F167408|nr:hypothetical protein [Alicyclobacillus fructus]
MRRVKAARDSGIQAIEGAEIMATANPHQSDDLRGADAPGATPEQAKPHVFQYAITPNRWPGQIRTS